MNRMTTAIGTCVALMLTSTAPAQTRDVRVNDNRFGTTITYPFAARDVVNTALDDFVLTDEESLTLFELGVTTNELEGIRNAIQYGFPRLQKPGRAYVALPIREPISREDIEIIVDTLNLSEGQQKFLDDRYVEYVAEARTLWNDLAAPLWNRSAQFAMMRDWTQERADSSVELYADVARAESRFHAADIAFIESLRPALADKQQPSLERVILLRSRATKTHPMVAASDIDLAALHRSLLSEDRIRFTPTDAVAFEQTLTEHERIITGYHGEFVAVSAKVSVARAWFYAAPDGDNDALRDDFMRLSKRHVETDHKMHREVMRAAMRLGEHLSPEARRQWRAQVRLKAFPVLYLPLDDPAGDLLNDWLNNEESELSTETLDALRSLRDDHDQRMAAANRSMEEPYLEWTIYRNSGGYRMTEYEPYRVQLVKRMKNRVDVLRLTLNSIAALVPDRPSAIQEVHATINDTVADLTETYGDSSRYGWPGPTDGYPWRHQRLKMEQRNAERRKQMEEAARRRREQQNNAGDDDEPS